MILYVIRLYVLVLYVLVFICNLIKLYAIIFLYIALSILLEIALYKINIIIAYIYVCQYDR